MDQRKRRTLLVLAAAFCMLLAVYQWGLRPLVQYKQELVQDQRQAAQRLEELLELKGQYERVKKSESRGEDLGKRSESFNLFSYLEEQTTKQGVKEWVTYMRPSTQSISEGLVEEQVQMRLEKVRLARFADFLKHVEYGPEGISVKRATIRSPRNAPGQLQVDLVFVVYRVSG